MRNKSVGLVSHINSISWPSFIVAALMLGTLIGLRSNAALVAFPDWYQSIHGDVIVISLATVTVLTRPNVKAMLLLGFAYFGFPLMAELFGQVMADDGRVGKDVFLQNWAAVGLLLQAAFTAFCSLMWALFGNTAKPEN